MLEATDPAIKLFGRTIPFAAATTTTTDDVIDKEELSSSDNDISKFNNNNNNVSQENEDYIVPKETDSSNMGDQDANSCHIQQSEDPAQGSDKSGCQDPSISMADNHESSSGADEKAAVEPSKSEEEKAETKVSQDKILKKPDKILPCPRCKSMDTKFCYYNNYNVNQPRHFCRNCQRYWTAGGTMRNVPVGAGRRKNKSPASHYRQITVSQALQNTRPDIPNGIQPGLQPDGTVLTFGSDSPLCESVASILNLAEKPISNFPSPNGFINPEELKIQIPFVAMETGGQLNGSNLENTTKSSSKEPPAQHFLHYPSQVPCYPGGPWPYPWNSNQWAPPVAAPPFSPNGPPLPYYPAPAYWACTVPGTWTIPLIGQPSHMIQSCPNSGPNSPTLGKHSRDGNVLTSSSSEEKGSENNGSERSLWIPKTLRIDDPGEAAKSSIWTTLGIKNSEKPGSIGKGSGLFKAFQSKCDERTPNLETSTALEANPAALSRSHNFQENS